MTAPRAYEEQKLVYGPHTVTLRPTLRAATMLEKLHAGFPALLDRLGQFHLGTVRAIITYSASEREASALLAYASTQPLSRFQAAAQEPLFALVSNLLPEPPADPQRPQPTARPTPWSTFYRHLFGYATGWLGWTPAEAWAATPTEITRAFHAHVESLKAIHGSADQDDPNAMTDEQRAQNIAEGLDPEFNRNALRSLKSRLA